MIRKRSNSNAQLSHPQILIDKLYPMNNSLNNEERSSQYKSITPTKRVNSINNLTQEEDLNTSVEQQIHKKIKKNTNVIVSVRKRPLSSKEIEFNSFSTVRIIDRKVVILLDPYEYNGHNEIFKNRNKEQHYTFDYSFDEDATQQVIYEDSVSHLLENILDGYNCTIFAYGATGAGKTYTMFGNENNPGIIPLSLDNLFCEVEKLRGSKIITVKMWYLEIYNEILRDLLKPQNEDQIDIREDPIKGSIVHGITEIVVQVYFIIAFKVFTHH